MIFLVSIDPLTTKSSNCARSDKIPTPEMSHAMLDLVKIYSFCLVSKTKKKPVNRKSHRPTPKLAFYQGLTEKEKSRSRRRRDESSRVYWITLVVFVWMLRVILTCTNSTYNGKWALHNIFLYVKKLELETFSPVVVKTNTMTRLNNNRKEMSNCCKHDSIIFAYVMVGGSRGSKEWEY